MKVVLTPDSINESKTDAETQVRGIIPAEQAAIKELVRKEELRDRLPATPKVERNFSYQFGNQKIYRGGDAQAGKFYSVGSDAIVLEFNGAAAIPSQTNLRINNITGFFFDLFVSFDYVPGPTFNNNYTLPVYFALAKKNLNAQNFFELYLNPFLGNLTISTSGVCNFTPYKQTFNLLDTFNRKVNNQGEWIFTEGRNQITPAQLSNILDQGEQLVYQVVPVTTAITLGSNDDNVLRGEADATAPPIGISGRFRINLAFRLQGNQAA